MVVCLVAFNKRKLSVVCIVAFNKSKLSVVASAFDRNLGGRDFDRAVLEHFAEEWKTKSDVDLHPTDSDPQVQRLLSEIEWARQQLSNGSACTKPLSIKVQQFLDGRYFASTLDARKFATIVEPLIKRALEPVKQVLSDAKLSAHQLDEVEMVGGATRSPLMVKALRELLGRHARRSVNSEEAVSLGCALSAAMSSRSFPGRRMAVSDCVSFPISLAWTGGPLLACRSHAGATQGSDAPGPRAPGAVGAIGAISDAGRSGGHLSGLASGAHRGPEDLR
ncbi:Hsp70 protein-domain-containing protein, partial [Baffinella frigidus]